MEIEMVMFVGVILDEDGIPSFCSTYPEIVEDLDLNTLMAEENWEFAGIAARRTEKFDVMIVLKKKDVVF